MSNARIYSNRGDCYQTLVAFDWALTVLDDPEYQWLEVDEWLNIMSQNDPGAMLQRVVSLQDALLAKGVNGIDDWLKAAERP